MNLNQTKKSRNSLNYRLFHFQPPVFVMSDLEDDDEMLDDIKIKTQLSLRTEEHSTPSPQLRSSNQNRSTPDITPSIRRHQNLAETSNIVVDNSFETIDLNTDNLSRSTTFANSSCGHVTCSSHSHPEPCITSI